MPIQFCHAMATANAAKRRRGCAARDAQLREFVGRGGVSTTALSEIIKAVGASPITNVTRADLHNAMVQNVLPVMTTEVVPLADGGEFIWEYCDPRRLIPCVLSKSPELRKLYARTLLECPCTMDRPWSVVLAFDELTPGNVLRQDNQRKMMNLCMNFLELGPSALCHDATWFIIAVVRSVKIKKVVGGWSRMFRMVLRKLFMGVDSLSAAGIAIALDDAPLLLFGSLGGILADLDGWKVGFDLKGAKALKPCAKCKNVLAKDSDLAGRAGDEFVELTCCDFSAFVAASDDDLVLSMEILMQATASHAAGTMAKAPVPYLGVFKKQRETNMCHKRHPMLNKGAFDKTNAHIGVSSAAPSLFHFLFFGLGSCVDRPGQARGPG